MTRYTSVSMPTPISSWPGRVLASWQRAGFFPYRPDHDRDRCVRDCTQHRAFRRWRGVVLELLQEPRRGLRVVARDTGPGIPDVGAALVDGYSTYHGLGLGLPGARRLMDEFAVVSEAGRGTTVTMTKWRQEG